MTTLQGWRFERLSWECPRKSEVSAASNETRGDAICGALDATKCREPGNGAGGPGDSRVRAMLAARNAAANRRHRAEAMKASAPSLHSASAHRATRIPEIGVGEKLARHLPPPAVRACQGDRDESGNGARGPGSLSRQSPLGPRSPLPIVPLAISSIRSRLRLAASRRLSSISIRGCRSRNAR